MCDVVKKYAEVNTKRYRKKLAKLKQKRLAVIEQFNSAKARSYEAKARIHKAKARIYEAKARIHKAEVARVKIENDHISTMYTVIKNAMEAFQMPADQAMQILKVKDADQKILKFMFA